MKEILPAMAGLPIRRDYKNICCSFSYDRLHKFGKLGPKISRMHNLSEYGAFFAFNHQVMTYFDIAQRNQHENTFIRQKIFFSLSILIVYQPIRIIRMSQKRKTKCMIYKDYGDTSHHHLIQIKGGDRAQGSLPSGESL